MMMKNRANSFLATCCLLSCGVMLFLAGCRDTDSTDNRLPLSPDSIPNHTAVLPSGVPLNTNLVGNASFEHWLKGLPLDWNLQNGSVMLNYDENSTGTRIKLLANPIAKQDTRLLQVIKGKDFRGHRFIASVRARATAPIASLYVIYKVKGQQKILEARHPGNGKWETLTITQRIAPNADPNFLVIRINNISSKSEEALFDDASFSFLD